MSLIEKKDWRVLEFFVPIKLKESLNDEVFIQGTAISETTTRNNHKYIAEELQNASNHLIGKPLLVDHRNEVDAIMGKVIHSYFDTTEKSIKFEAQIMDSNIKAMVKDGRLSNVSVGCFCKDLVKDESSEAYIAKGLEIAELSLVAVPADTNASFTMAMDQSIQLKEKYMAEEMKKCPECGKMVEEDKMKKHMSSHEYSKNERGYSDMDVVESAELKEMEAIKAELNQLKAEKRQNLIVEYKAICEQKRVKARDTSNLSDDTIKILSEQLKDVQVFEREFKSVVSEDKSKVPSNLMISRTESGKIEYWAMPDKANKGKITNITW